MILLENYNRILEETIKQRLYSSKRDVLDVTLADFDGVSFHVSTPNAEARNIVNVSLAWAAANDLLNNGAHEYLKKIYGPLLQSHPEEGFNLTLQLDLDHLPEDGPKLCHKVALLKRHILAAPFARVFESVVNKTASSDIIKIGYRDQEAFYIKPEGDRCMVIFSIAFRDADDQILAKVFLQEFSDARRNMRNVPAVSYTYREAPLELQNYPGLTEERNVGFVTFVLFEDQLSAKNMHRTIDLLENFRDYLHYHIKCSKAYMHDRMRNQVATWLQVLNRARPEPFEKKEKKLASGRTFVRK